jgi:hypothetical protein
MLRLVEAVEESDNSPTKGSPLGPGGKLCLADTLANMPVMRDINTRTPTIGDSWYNCSEEGQMSVVDMDPFMALRDACCFKDEARSLLAIIFIVKHRSSAKPCSDIDVTELVFGFARGRG